MLGSRVVAGKWALGGLRSTGPGYPGAVLLTGKVVLPVRRLLCSEVSTDPAEGPV